jgi:hypothetical protein
MRKAVLYHWLVRVFLTLFIGLQSLNIAQAAEHASTHHEHDCITCDVTVLAEDETALLSIPLVFETIETEFSQPIFAQIKSALYVAPQSRAPPPRAPPNSI